MLELVVVSEVSVVQALWYHATVLPFLLDLTPYVCTPPIHPWTYVLPGPACLRLQREGPVPSRDSHQAHHNTEPVFPSTPWYTSLSAR